MAATGVWRHSWRPRPTSPAPRARRRAATRRGRRNVAARTRGVLHRRPLVGPRRPAGAAPDTPCGVLTEPLTDRPSRSTIHLYRACQDLTGPQVRSGPGRRPERRVNGVAWSATRRSGFVGRRDCRGQEQVVGRRRRRRVGHAEEGGHHLQGPVPVPRREDALVRRHPGARDVALLRLRPGRRHLQLRHAARRRDVPRGAAQAGRQGRRRDRRADQARGRPPRAAPPGARHGDRLLPRGPDQLEGRRAGARLPQGPRLHRRDDRDVPARLGARRLGPDDPPAAGQARHPPRGAHRGRPGQPEPARPRRHRQVPFARPVPDPRPERPRGRPRRPAAGRGGAEVPQLPGDAAVRQEPDAVPHRQGQGRHPQGRTRPSSSRATPTP